MSARAYVEGREPQPGDRWAFEGAAPDGTRWSGSIDIPPTKFVPMAFDEGWTDLVVFDAAGNLVGGLGLGPEPVASAGARLRWWAVECGS